LDEHTSEFMNIPTDALTGAFKRQHPMGPYVCKQTRQDTDAYYCENNLIATNIQDHASNSLAITSATSGKAAVEYLNEYMVKKKQV
jgi:hypothetical protein